MQQYYPYAQGYQMPFNQRQPFSQPSYQPMAQHPATSPHNALQPIVSYVNGIEGAKAYILFPNQSVVLLDSDDKERLYIKSSNEQGMATITAYQLTKLDESKKEDAKIDTSAFATKKELDELKEYISKNTVFVSKQISKESEVK